MASFMDVEFFKMLIRTYLFAHGREMGVFENKDTRAKQKRLTVVINFDDNNEGTVLSPNNYELRSFKEMGKDERFTKASYRSWEQADRIAAKENRVVVAAFFPVTIGLASSAVCILETFSPGQIALRDTPIPGYDGPLADVDEDEDVI